jgi:hypothetical protein
MILSQLYMATVIAGNAGECVGVAIGLGLGLLFVGAVTGGAGWVIAGAYEPVLAGLCGLL